MIGRLSGSLLEKQPPWIVIDVHGVGYELETSMNTLVALPAPGRAFHSIPTLLFAMMLIFFTALPENTSARCFAP